MNFGTQAKILCHNILIASILLLHYMGILLIFEVFLVSPERRGQPGTISEVNKTL